MITLEILREEFKICFKEKSCLLKKKRGVDINSQYKYSNRSPLNYQ